MRKIFRLIGLTEIIVGALFLLAAGVNAATYYKVVSTPWAADYYAQYALEWAIPGIILLTIGLCILIASKATPTPA
jgi:ABC-type uncharacterized transport system permease subunit